MHWLSREFRHSLGLKIWYRSTRLKEQFWWPLYQYWQKMGAMAACPSIKAVLKEMEYHYIDLQGIRIAFEERSQRGITDDYTLAYGETHWRTLILCLEAVGITPGDVFVDLGCGKGLLAFFAALRYGIAAIGIDQTETFIEIAQAVAETCQVPQLTFIADDFFNFDFSRGTVFYVTSTCYDTDILERLGFHLLQARSGSRIISITQPFKTPGLQLECQLSGNYTWGRDLAYIYRRA